MNQQNGHGMKYTIKQEPTYWARIYLAGDLRVAKQICRKHCLEVGLCVTIEETTFIYTGGEEFGVVVGLINYPRFPDTEEGIFQKAETLALLLLEGLHQHSCLVMSPDETKWFTRRGEV
jgi:hypothetical protein